MEIWECGPAPSASGQRKENHRIIDSFILEKIFKITRPNRLASKGQCLGFLGAWESEVSLGCPPVLAHGGQGAGGGSPNAAF